jgi:hypothetical protein
MRLRKDYLLAFALACTGALAWVDTMSDLALGVCGAALYLSFAALAAWRARAAR